MSVFSLKSYYTRIHRPNYSASVGQCVISVLLY